LLHFAREAVLGLVTLESEDLSPPRLTLPLTVSVWMRRSRVGTGTARRALLELRTVLLEASGLDATCEPVPLSVSDPAVATLSLAVYLHGLLQRAAHGAATTRVAIAERAVEMLAA
jgi:hypothetical protein